MTGLEARVDTLEKKVAELMNRILAPPTERNWRSTVEMLANDSNMKEIQEVGKHIREAEREQAKRDYS